MVKGGDYILIETLVSLPFYSKLILIGLKSDKNYSVALSFKIHSEPRFSSAS